MVDVAAIPLGRHEGRYSLSFIVPADAPFFDGHFPGDPLVPAAQLLAWIQVAVARVDPAVDKRGQFERAKFLAPVRPGARLHIEWMKAEAGWSIIAQVDAVPVLRAQLVPVSNQGSF